MAFNVSETLAGSPPLTTNLASALLSTASLGLLLYWLSKWYYSTATHLPDGPWGFPILGHLPLIGSHPHHKFSEWAKTYGSVFRIRMGSRFTVVISGYKAVKQALVNQSEDFAGRPDFYSFQFISGGISMAFGQYGPQWKPHKTLARNALSLFTQKRVHHLEAQVVDEADTIIEELLASKAAVDPKRSFHVATAAIVYSICFEDGSSIRENESFLDVLNNIDEFGKIVGAGGNPVDLMPWTLPFLKGRMQKFISLMRNFTNTNTDAQTRLRQNWVPNQPRNLSDALFDIVEDTGEAKLREMQLSTDHILRIVGDVTGAGQATITSFLYWALLYIVKFPDVQSRVHEEIDCELGSARTPSYEDRLRLPYCEAFFFEIMRHSVSLPFLLPHAATRDCTLLGYDIPAGALVFFNIESVSMDPKLWDKPSEFEPARFIDPATGQLDRNKTEQVIAFGMGKRRCMGEFLGRLESFVFFVRLLQRCEFSKADGQQYSLEGIFGLGLDAAPYKVRVQLRG